jgi:hypothetical protein
MGQYWGLRTTESRDSVEHWSRNVPTVRNPQQTSVTVFFGALDSRCFIRGNEIHYEVAKKAQIKISSPSKGPPIAPCRAASATKPNGSNGNSVKIFF